MRRIRSKTSAQRSTPARKPQAPTRRRRQRARRQRWTRTQVRARRVWRKPLAGFRSPPAAPLGPQTRLGVMRALPRRVRRPRRREPSKTTELGRITFEMRLSVHITIHWAPAPESKRRPLLAWCNERTGLATMLTLVATIVMLGLMAWQQLSESPPRLACPSGTKVCNVNTITNNFYGPLQLHAGSGGQRRSLRPLRQRQHRHGEPGSAPARSRSVGPRGAN